MSLLSALFFENWDVYVYVCVGVCVCVFMCICVCQCGVCVSVCVLYFVLLVTSWQVGVVKLLANSFFDNTSAKLCIRTAISMSCGGATYKVSWACFEKEIKSVIWIFAASTEATALLRRICLLACTTSCVTEFARLARHHVDCCIQPSEFFRSV